MSVNLWAGSRKDWIDRRVRERHWEDGHQASPEMVRRWQIRYGRKYDAARLLLNSQDFRIPPTPENMDKLRALLSVQPNWSAPMSKASRRCALVTGPWLAP